MKGFRSFRRRHSYSQQDGEGNPTHDLAVPSVRYVLAGHAAAIHGLPMSHGAFLSAGVPAGERVGKCIEFMKMLLLLDRRSILPIFRGDQTPVFASLALPTEGSCCPSGSIADGSRWDVPAVEQFPVHSAGSLLGF